MATFPDYNVNASKFFNELTPAKSNVCQATYVWIGNCDNGPNLRSKTRTLLNTPKTLEELPVWNYDGSSTGQATTGDSELWLKPVFFCPDPFNRGTSILVLCETCLPTKELIPTE